MQLQSHMRIHELSVDDALTSLRSTSQGLSSLEAQRRLREFGLNRVEELVRQHPLLRLLSQFIQFFSLILWAAAALAFFAEWRDPGQGMARLGFAIVAVILISGLFSFWQERRAEQTLAAMRALLPTQVKVLRQNKVVLLAAEQLVPGDIVMIEQGDHVPADCRLIEAFGVRADNATITGESLPRSLEADNALEDELIRAKNIVFAGTSLVSGQAKAVVFTTGMQTEFGKIAGLTQRAMEVVSPLSKEIAHLSHVIGIMAVAIGLLFFAAGWSIGVPFWSDLTFAIGIIVAMVPEGLLPTLTLALVLATQRMAKRNVLIRHLPSVEALGSATVICTDKTGTLTQNRMLVRQLFLGEQWVSVDSLESVQRLAQRYLPFFLTALHCQDLKESEQQGKSIFLGDPMEVALVELARRALAESDGAIGNRVYEIPFDAERMRLCIVHATPEGASAYCKGALQAIMPLCSSMLRDGVPHPFTSEWRKKIIAAEERMAEKGLRILAFAYRQLARQWNREQVEQELVFAGLAGLEDPPRPEVSAAMRKCREAGIKVIMVTGDHPRTAEAIAREIGLVQSNNPLVLTGERLRGLSDAELRLELDSPEIIFARASADQKLRIVQALRGKQHVVAVTGDGVNDAPALKAADIGVAMGITGTDVAKEASDVVLLDDNFASLVNVVEEGRAVFENIRKFLTYILAHNVPELIPYLGFSLFAVPLALTPIQILSVDMGTDSLTALGLGIERPDPQIMRRPPRSRSERLFNWRLALRAYIFLGMIEAVAAMGAFFFVLHSGGWKYGEILGAHEALYMQATTACLSAIIVMQIVNVFLCRHTTRSVFSTGLRGNALIIWGVALEIALLLLINYTPLGNIILGTAPISARVWPFVIPFAIAMLALEELRKLFVRRRQKLVSVISPDISS
jgi:calcium-translocating P-type ATPase